MAVLAMAAAGAPRASCRPLSAPVTLGSCAFLQGSKVACRRWEGARPGLSQGFSLQVEAAKKVQGKVVCASNDKTVAVEVFRIAPHPKYGKRIKSSKKYQAHDPDNSAKVGDTVTLVKCAPVSKTKAFVVTEIRPSRVAVRKVAAAVSELTIPFESVTPVT